ncbi:hypothetical protein [Maliponia aquimaris]|uniref:Lipopolysaccharide-assembly, LptC-related n=1 Tax=Maliponia aquimaris TaxID=1673631 RepID=A0A238JSR1_9RHOB|nr:hypothetical protein [Maliponia aquimaris]SMX33699.1 hypothetical protein MAA8898_00518 [Maliponia aquimaris]
MARAGGLYSRVIAWLKILLPLAALALLSTMFLLSRPREPLQNAPFADALSSGAADQKVTAPYYAGTTERGDMLTMTARTARPQEGGSIVADRLEARMRLSDGSEIRLDATEALLRDREHKALLSGGVRIESSQGYVLTTEGLVSHLDKVAAESTGPVQGVGPMGHFEAGHLKILPAEADGEVQLLFSGGVKLVYQPPDNESTSE